MGMPSSWNTAQILASDAGLDGQRAGLCANRQIEAFQPKEETTVKVAHGLSSGQEKTAR
jgi:hypothetical protein